MGRLLVFNPEHDYALAQRHKHYYPPAGILKLRRRFQFIPALSAKEGDFVLLDDNQVYDAGNNDIMQISTIEGIITEIVPWGWDYEIKTRMESLGIKESLLPTDKDIETLRALSHRRLSIDCNSFIDSGFLPEELFDEKSAMEYYDRHKNCCFKAPFSSSGRGIMFCQDLRRPVIQEWVHGVIKKQGSILCETSADKLLDLATLWFSHNEEIEFRGFSLSLTDPRGKYKGNILATQENIKEYISDFVDIKSLQRLVAQQKKFLTCRVASHYEGRLGIDMLIDKNGEIRPCLEINLRNTMGHVSMDVQDLSDNGMPSHIKDILNNFSEIFITFPQS